MPTPPRATIATASWCPLASRSPDSARSPIATMPNTGSPVPSIHARTDRVATPGTASRSGAPWTMARTAAGRSSSSVTRYAHEAVTIPVIATMIATRTPRAPEYVAFRIPNSAAATSHSDTWSTNSRSGAWSTARTSGSVAGRSAASHSRSRSRPRMPRAAPSGTATRT